MIELETPERKASELPADMAGRRSGRGAFRRRSATRVLVIGGFILLTVWGLRYVERSRRGVSHRGGRRSGPAVGARARSLVHRQDLSPGAAGPARGGRGLLPVSAVEIGPAPRTIDLGDARAGRRRTGTGREPARRGRGRGLSWGWRPSRRHWPFWNGSSPATSFKTTTLPACCRRSCRAADRFSTESSPTSIRAN